ncbi:hypothetical protein M885DRAFT_511344 [Pelagophyceae sp. CCMP2097]|nr:hypothetical protein M885DRAFT_511344 [Pelagophyceae sp. CCMP2097]
MGRRASHCGLLAPAKILFWWCCVSVANEAAAYEVSVDFSDWDASQDPTEAARRVCRNVQEDAFDECAQTVAAEAALRSRATLPPVAAFAYAKRLRDDGRHADSAALLWPTLNTSDAQQCAFLGLALAWSRDFKKAVKWLSHARNLAPAGEGMLSIAAFALEYEYAQSLQRTLAPRAALRILEGLDVRTTEPSLLAHFAFLRGSISSDLGLGAAALADLRTAVALDQDSATMWRFLGLVTLDYGEPAAAVAALETARLLEPSDLGTIHSLERARVAAAGDKRTLDVVTFASNETECGYRRLVASARSYGVEVVNIGGAAHWPAGHTVWSNGLKLELVYVHARALAEKDADALMMAVDGYDVALAGGLKSVKMRFDRLGVEKGTVVLSGDQTFYFQGEREQCYGEHYPPARHGTPYRFVNSGSLIGRAEDVAALMKHALVQYAQGWSGVSDQTLLHRVYADAALREFAECVDGFRTLRCGAEACDSAPPVKIIIDAHQVLFANTGGRANLRDLEVSGGRIRNKLTDTYPVVVHCPGEKRFRAEFDRLKDLGWAADVVECHDDAGD